MNINKRAKKSHYPKLESGDMSEFLWFIKKGYKDRFSLETHKVEDENKGLYIVDGSSHPIKGFAT